jgi:hypothetical protein
MHFQTVNPLILTLPIDVSPPKNHELLSIFTSSINNNPSGTRQEPSANRQFQRSGSPAHRPHRAVNLARPALDNCMVGFDWISLDFAVCS